MRSSALILMVVLTGALGLPDLAPAAEQPVQRTAQTAELEDLLDAVTSGSGQRFLVDSRVPAKVVTGPVKPEEVTYAILLSILRNNALAAATIDGVVNIVPLPTIRQYPLRTISKNDDSIPGDEWVLRVIQVENAEAVRLVPILRPNVVQAGHFVAHEESNILLLVAPYGVTKHLAGIIEMLDANTRQGGSK